MDPMADAWTDLAQAFGLDLAVICHGFPPPNGIRAYESIESFMKDAGAKVAFADNNFKGKPVDLIGVDWLVIGHATGWEPPKNRPKWRYDPSPEGGWHALHLAHAIVQYL